MMNVNVATESQWGDELRGRLARLSEGPGTVHASSRVGRGACPLRSADGKRLPPSRWMVVLILSLAAVLGACRPSRSARNPAPSPTRVLASVTATATTASAEVIAAWNHYWQVYV